MSPPRRPSWVENLRRLLALACAVCVFALGVFAASPQLHAQLHGHADSVSDDGCPVVLFASGVSLPTAVIAVPPPAIQRREPCHVRSVELFLDAPRYLLQPERGPPVG